MSFFYNGNLNPHKFQIFVPNEVSVFGSAYHQVNLKHLASCDGVRSQILHVKKSHIKAIDKPSQHCNAGSAEPNTSACIADFIEREIGCNPNILGSQHSERPLCSTKAQLLQLEKLYIILSGSADNDVYDMTGCLSSCEKDIYSIVAEPQRELKRDRPRKCEEFYLLLRITDRSFENRKQYIIYDTDSFVADVGGYMGLLLGCSIMSLFNEIDLLLSAGISKFIFRHKTKVGNKNLIV